MSDLVMLYMLVQCALVALAFFASRLFSEPVMHFIGGCNVVFTIVFALIVAIN